MDACGTRVVESASTSCEAESHASPPLPPGRFVSVLNEGPNTPHTAPQNILAPAFALPHFLTLFHTSPHAGQVCGRV
eukprot:360024-Chlamydomonas_euryale.AAC.2